MSKPEAFVKLFEFEDIGQVLIKRWYNESEVSLDIHSSHKGIGLVSKVYSFDNYEKSDKLFNEFDEDLAYKQAKKLVDELDNIFEE